MASPSVRLLVATVAYLVTSWNAINCHAFLTSNHIFHGVSSKKTTTTAFNPHRTISQIINIPSPADTAAFMDTGGDFFDELFDNEDVEPTSEKKAPEEEEEEDDDSEDDFLLSLFDDYIPKLNVVTLSGRVGQDPEPRYFDDGKVVLNLSLAVKRKYHPLERQALDSSELDETDWFQLEFWGRDAEYAANYLSKGCRVGVTGSLEVNHWQDRKTGEARSSNRILCRHLDILESRAERELRENGERGGSNYSSRGGNVGYGGGGGGGSRSGTGGSRSGTGGSFFDDDESDTASAGSGGFFD